MAKPLPFVGYSIKKKRPKVAGVSDTKSKEGSTGALEARSRNTKSELQRQASNSAIENNSYIAEHKRSYSLAGQS